jgi:hypothetical protein
MRILFLLAVACLSGCATISAGECQNAYDVGFRDAIFGVQRQDPLYLSQCEGRGTRLDTAAYGRGWQEGNYEYEQRKIHGGVE